MRFAAVDRTENDTKLSDDFMEFAASFTDEEGNEWEIVQLALAASNPVMDPWYVAPPQAEGPMS